ncbi:MAG: general secretion pathway protein C [Hylemonella sp.]|uniref:type II secretion system protein N n=1 Tax=Hylemonella sp. TaxID=2066020 RepID=UPI0022CA9DC1|nr:type II secretion system protein N [Hylemonella sp.]MCZ8252326.1 general secretion pathway protein C [Hylemonella sp.]
MSSSPSPMAWPRLTAFGLAALLAGSAVYWVLRWPGLQPQADAVQAVSLAPAATVAPEEQRRLLAQLLGAGARVLEQAPAGLAARLVLSGVVANAAGSGAALISVDGKPARAYTVGSVVVEGLVLQAVAPRRAMLATDLQAPVDLTLELKRPVR